MPIVAEELGDLELYGWVYSAFFLGNLLGTVLAGGALDRQPLHRPFAVGLVLFAGGLLIGGLAPSMQVLVVARFIQGLGGGAVAPTAYVAIGRVLPETPPAADVRDAATAWVVPGIIGPCLAAVVGEVAGWRGCSSGCCRCCSSPAGCRCTRSGASDAAESPRRRGTVPRTRRLAALVAAAAAGARRRSSRA